MYCWVHSGEVKYANVTLLLHTLEINSKEILLNFPFFEWIAWHFHYGMTKFLPLVEFAKLAKESMRTSHFSEYSGIPVVCSLDRLIKKHSGNNSFTVFANLIWSQIANCQQYTSGICWNFLHHFYVIRWHTPPPPLSYSR